MSKNMSIYLRTSFKLKAAFDSGNLLLMPFQLFSCFLWLNDTFCGKNVWRSE